MEIGGASVLGSIAAKANRRGDARTTDANHVVFCFHQLVVLLGFLGPGCCDCKSKYVRAASKDI